MDADVKKIGLISLGCPKNLVDSEVMLGLLTKEGHQITTNESEADVMVVNTCAFIDPSKRESVDTILEIADLKQKGNLKKLIVTGCLSQRYKSDLEKEFPEVDHFLGTGEFHHISSFVSDEKNPRSIIKKPEYVYDFDTPRISALPPHTAYVKIAEGCSRTCSFCIIPRLRGRGRSRSIDSVVEEARLLGSRGVKEMNLVAQDLTAYGLDRNDGATLEALLEKLIDVDGIEWIRLIYNYPMYFTDRLVELIASSEKICKYLDIPLQHIDSGLLASMQRKVDEKETRKLLDRLRSDIPGLTLRTTLIVGFPGETDRQFRKLLNFVREVEFDRLGVFTYSKEEGTVAATLPRQVPEKIKRKRYDRLMKVQQEISAKRYERLIGKTHRVLVDRALPSPNGYTHIGRTEGQAPDIDGLTFLSGESINIGSFVEAKAVESAEYDLYAQLEETKKWKTQPLPTIPLPTS